MDNNTLQKAKKLETEIQRLEYILEMAKGFAYYTKYSDYDSKYHYNDLPSDFNEAIKQLILNKLTEYKKNQKHFNNICISIIAVQLQPK